MTDGQITSSSVGAIAVCPTNPDVVYIEHMTEALYLETPLEVDGFTLAFDHLRARALDPDESVARIESIINDLCT